ncbi:MAG: [FeFe] hydrogenase, group A, partial [Chitinivibrionales bacterium]
MIDLTVNNKKIRVKKDQTLLQAFKKNNIHVPALCAMDDLTPTGACRLCVVEIEGVSGLVPACSTPVREGMVVTTHSRKVLNARKTIVELLLADHPDDCLYCERNGNCELQTLAQELGVKERKFFGEKNRFKKDISSLSIKRDPEKCILCGRCVRVCEEIQSVSAIDFIGRGCTTQVGTAFDEGINISSCINCGQCINVCPTGALSETSNIPDVEEALQDPEKVVVVQHAPSISVTLGEEFDISPGKDICGAMTAALRRMGFDYVFDTALSADLTIMEEASELAYRLKNNGALPMFTSCSPGWIKFIEQSYPELIENVSTCKSPQQMMGAVIKHYWAEKMGIDPEKVYSVSIMPCTAKKFEAGRPEMSEDSVADVDAVLTTRELASMIRKHGIAVAPLKPEKGDDPLAERSSAGKIFGVTGGVMEAAARTAHYMITGEEMENLDIKDVRGFKSRKEAKLKIGDVTVGVAVVHGLGNAREIIEEIRNGREDLHFI